MTQWFKDRWPFGSKAKEPEDTSSKHRQLTRIRDLSLYPHGDDLSSFHFVEEDLLPLQKSISGVRISVQDSYDAFAARYGGVQTAVNTTKSAYNTTRAYLREDNSLVPKAIAITVGGMGGFVLGYRRGGFIRQVLYSATGMGLTGAFCYPHETLDIGRYSFRTGSAKIRSLWSDFQEAPPPPSAAAAKSGADSKKGKDEGAGPTHAKDKDMYTTRST